MQKGSQECPLYRLLHPTYLHPCAMLSSMLCQHWLAQLTKSGCWSQWIVGRLAQLEECFVCNEDAGGSNPPASTTGFFLIDIVVSTLVVDSPFVGCFSPLPTASTTLEYIILNQRTNTSCITMLANKTTTIFT